MKVIGNNWKQTIFFTTNVGEQFEVKEHNPITIELDKPESALCAYQERFESWNMPECLLPVGRFNSLKRRGSRFLECGIVSNYTSVMIFQLFIGP